MKRILSAFLAAVLSLSLGVSAFATAMVSPADVFDDFTGTVYDNNEDYVDDLALPVVNGLLAWVQDDYEILTQTFDDATDTYRVSTVLDEDSTSIWLGLTFTEEPDYDPTISTVTENSDIDGYEYDASYYYHYHTGPSNTGDIVYCYYFEFDIDEELDSSTSEFTLQLSGSPSENRTLVLTMGHDSEDNHGFAAERAEEETFWETLPPMADDTANSGTVSFDAKFYENIPHWVVDALAGSDKTLNLTYRDKNGVKQTAAIDCSKISKTDSNRVFFTICDFIRLYA